MRWDQLGEVLLVGGSTRMPMIQTALSDLSGRRFAEGFNPDESVALGAALTGVLRHRPNHPALRAHRQAIARRAQATMKAPSAPAAPLIEPPEEPEEEAPLPGLPPIRIKDATTHPLGMIVLDRSHNERVLTLIKASTPVPCERRKRLGYAYDNTTAVRIEITEGAGRTREEVKVVGEVILDKLPPRRKGTPLEVLYRYNVNQILEVYILDVETNTRHHAQINLRGGMGKKKLSRVSRELAQARIH